MTTYLYDISLENLLTHIRGGASKELGTDYDRKLMGMNGGILVFHFLFDFTILVILEWNHHANRFL